MAARAHGPIEVALRPLTLGRYLAMRAALLSGVTLPEIEENGETIQVYVPIEPDVTVAPADALPDFLDEAIEAAPAPEAYASADDLRRFAARVWAAVSEVAGRAAARAVERAEWVETYTGHYLSSGPDGDQVEPPIEHMVGCLEPHHYAAIRDLPFWEGMMVLRCRNVVLAKQESDRKADAAGDG